MTTTSLIVMAGLIASAIGSGAFSAIVQRQVLQLHDQRECVRVCPSSARNPLLSRARSRINSHSVDSLVSSACPRYYHAFTLRNKR
jgi:hypothetical protein